jgi:hypothetical protein
MGDLNHLVVHGWLASLREAKGLSDRTVVRLYRVFHRAMADAPLDRNPAALPKHLRPVVRSKRDSGHTTCTSQRSTLEEVFLHRTLVTFAGFVILETLGKLIGVVKDVLDRPRGGHGCRH